jgi:hypothetical protein
VVGRKRKGAGARLDRLIRDLRPFLAQSGRATDRGLCQLSANSGRVERLKTRLSLTKA